MNSYIRQKTTDNNISRWYKIDEAKDPMQAIEYLYSIKNIPNLTVKYIKLYDNTNNSNPNNGDIQLRPDADCETIINTFRNHGVNNISMVGEYNGSNITISMHLYGFRPLTITVGKDRLTDLENIEKEL